MVFGKLRRYAQYLVVEVDVTDSEAAYFLRPDEQPEAQLHNAVVMRTTSGEVFSYPFPVFLRDYAAPFLFYTQPWQSGGRIGGYVTALHEPVEQQRQERGLVVPGPVRGAVLR